MLLLYLFIATIKESELELWNEYVQTSWFTNNQATVEYRKTFIVFEYLKTFIVFQHLKTFIVIVFEYLKIFIVFEYLQTFSVFMHLFRKPKPFC